MTFAELFGRMGTTMMPPANFGLIGFGFLIGLLVGALIVVGLFAAFCEK